jgi:predicted ArsR family transcriptional regulator
VEALRSIYFDGDRFITVERGRGPVRLIEHNCPYLNLAMDRPAICSVTVATLSRALGLRVVREERLQDGDARCTFCIHPDEPVEPASGFTAEPER